MGRLVPRCRVWNGVALVELWAGQSAVESGLEEVSWGVFGAWSCDRCCDWCKRAWSWGVGGGESGRKRRSRSR